MMTCPECHRSTAEGRFCERCGAPLADRSADADARIERMCAQIDRRTADSDEPTLAYDRTCALFEGMSGIVRFRFGFNGCGETLENVVVELSNATLGQPLVQRFRHVSRTEEFIVQFPPQAVGLQSWNVHLAYQSSRRKHDRTGQLQLVVRPVASRGRAAGTYNINFNTNVGNVGHASDVNVYSHGAEELAHLVEKDNPFEEMERLARSDARDWLEISLSDDNAVVDLPEMEAAAKTDHIVLDFGNHRVHFFAARTLRFGRTREQNEIALRPPPGADETATRPYRMVSRAHCAFEQAGENVILSDGCRDALGVVHPSSGGTFWEDRPVEDGVSIAAGQRGVAAFGAPACAGGLSIGVQACSPAKACATCPHAKVRWCGEGRHASLLLKRRDGIAESFVALWSCFCMGEANPMFEDVVIFRKDGAFAYRNGSKSGWLVPETTLHSDFGPIRILGGDSRPTDFNQHATMNN